MVMVIQCCEYAKTSHFKRMNFMVYELYLDFKKSQVLLDGEIVDNFPFSMSAVLYSLSF